MLMAFFCKGHFLPEGGGQKLVWLSAGKAHLVFDSVVPNQKLSFSALYILPSDPAAQGKTGRLESR